MRKILIMLSLLIIATGCITTEREEKNTLFVSATGTVKGVPDNAVISLSVVTQDVEAQKVLTDNSNRMNSIINALKEIGISEKEIHTSQVTLYPEYEPIKPDMIYDGMRKIVGYKAINTIEVTVLKVNETGKVIDEGIKAGANEVQNLYFKFSEDRSKKLYQEALQKAAKDAKQKAATISNAMGVKIIRTFKITESGPIYPIATRSFAVAELKAEPTPVSPGELEVSASISVEYEIN